MRRWIILALIAGSVGTACGARTGLFAPEELDAAIVDAAQHPDVHDASIEPDVIEEPVPDVVFPDVIETNCADAGVTYVYVLGSQNELYSFYPPTLAFTSIGTVSCSSTAQPNSMAVTRAGIAFANYSDGHLFEISTANAACKATTYVPSQDGIKEYGMGYAANADGGETLYVESSALGLGFIDTQAFTLGVIGQFQPPEPWCELTGTGDGRLFGFCPFVSGSYVKEFDPATATVLTSHQLSATSGTTGSWAFAFWGGDFWLFTGPGLAPSTVTKYDPVAQTETTVATAPLSIVGAGVSTCAPESL